MKTFNMVKGILKSILRYPVRGFKCRDKGILNFNTRQQSRCILK